MLPLVAFVCLHLLGTAAADELYSAPYGPLRHQRQYERDAPFPLSSGSRMTLSSGSLRPPEVALFSTSSSSTSVQNVAPRPVGPATASAISTTTAQVYPTYNYSHIPASDSSASVTSNSSHVSFFSVPASRWRPALTSNSSNVSFIHVPTGTAPPVRPSRGPVPFQNGTCIGATVNVVEASLDWWYTQTYTQVESTFLIQLNGNESSTGWTLLPAETSFDVTSAVADPTCNSATAFNTLANETQIHYTCWSTPAPTAAATTTVEQTAFKPINATTSKGAIPNVVTQPTPAVLTLNGSNSTVAEGIPVVHFSKFEVVTKRPSRQYDGRVQCYEATTTHTLNRVHTFEYVGANVDEPAAADGGVIGQLHFALLQAIGQTTATPGTWVAEPTVVVVVQKIVAGGPVMAKGVEQPAAELETVTPTLPPGMSTLRSSPTEEGTFWAPLTSHIELSETALDVPTKTKTASAPNNHNAAPTDGPLVNEPFVARLESSDVTIQIPVNPTLSRGVVTALFEGKTVTATALAANAQPTGGDVGRLVSLIAGAASPTDALEVLTEAQNTAAHGEPAASSPAIIVGAESTVAAWSSSGGAVSSSESQDNDGGQIGQDVDPVQHPDGADDGEVVSGSQDTSDGSPSGLHNGGQNSNGGNRPSEQASGNDEPSSDGQNRGSVQTFGGQGTDGNVDSNGEQFEDLQGSGTGLGTGSGPGSGSNSRFVFDIGGSIVTGSMVGGQTAPAVVIGGQTASAGGSAITIDGTKVSVPPGADFVVIGASTNKIAQPSVTPDAAANIPLITVGSKTFTANAATQFNVDGSVLTPGGRVVVAGTTISLSPDASEIVVNGQTEGLSPAAITPAPLLTVGGTVYRANSGRTYNVGGHLVSPGGAIVVSGTTISIAADGADVIVNGIVQSIEQGGTNRGDLATITAPPMLTIDGQAFSPNGGTTYIIYGQTLTPGGAITYDGPNGIETVSLNADANQLMTVVKGVTATSAILGISTGSGTPVLTINGNTYTAIDYHSGSGATYIVNGQTLSLGGLITLTDVSGVATYSLDPVGMTFLTISDDTTSTSHISMAYGILPTNAPILTIGGNTFTAINNIGPTYMINGDTLTPGGTDTVVINGKTYIVTLSPHATLLEIEILGPDGRIISTSFETLFPATMTGSTVYNTAIINGATATAGAIPNDGSISSTGSTNTELSNRASPIAVGVTSALVALGSFAAVVVWL